MNRTDRLYALVEELRAVSPRPRSAAWLARRFEVSLRTIERDLEALRQSGVPITGDVGRTGGYHLDRDRTLAPLMLTAAEALAVTVALRAAASTPFAAAARQAALKMLAVLPADVRSREETLTRHVHRVGDHSGADNGVVAATVATAVISGLVVTLDYTDANHHGTHRDVEPMGLLWGPQGWYLMGWCRLRDGIRGFLLSRMTAAQLTDERAPEREDALQAELDRLDARPISPASVEDVW